MFSRAAAHLDDVAHLVLVLCLVHACSPRSADNPLLDPNSPTVNQTAPVSREQSLTKQLSFLSTILKRSAPLFAKTRTRSPQSFSKRSRQTPGYFFHAKVFFINFRKNAQGAALS